MNEFDQQRERHGNFRPDRGFEPRPLRCQCSAPPVELLANWEQAVKWVDDQPVDVEIDYDNSGTLYVFELRIGMNEFDHRCFFSKMAS